MKAYKEHVGYGYCAELEVAMQELFGGKSKWYGMAGSFQQPSAVREAIRSATKQLRRRLREVVTVDDRLNLTTSLTLDGIDRNARDLGKQGLGELRVIADLLHLSARLLGYDWMLGQPNREVIYFQTVDQQARDDRYRHPSSPMAEYELLHGKLLAIVRSLHEDGLRVRQIGQILSLTDARVKDLLVRGGADARGKNTKAT